MSEEIKNNFSTGLNLDDSPFLLPPASYVDALNITRNALAASQDNVITNMVGNQSAMFTLPTGTNICIGAFPFQLRGTIIYFVYNSNAYHGVYEFTLTTRVTAKVFQNLTDSAGVDILGFTQNNKIKSINVYPRDEGDLLFFLDSIGRPTQMDITRFKAGEYTPVTRNILDKCKKPPLATPSAVYDNDTTTRSNELRDKLFRFKYRWIYDDYEKSVFSPICQLPLPVSILDDTFTNVVTNNNVIRMVMNSGDKNVSGIELAVSYVSKTSSWSDFQSVEVFKKTVLAIADNTDFPFAFYNSATYPSIDINESLLLFDYVPDLANCQDMPNGNVLAYAGITEGIDKITTESATITVLTVVAGNGGTVGSLNALVTHDGTESAFPYPGDQEVMNYTFSGVPANGTIVNLSVRRKSDHSVVIASTYTTVSGDTSDLVAQHIAANNTAPYIQNRYLGTSIMSTRIPHFNWEQIPIALVYSEMSITPPTSSLASNSVSSWKWSSQGNIGRQYFDIHGKTNGVLYSDRIVFPAYAENGSSIPLIPYINYKINDVPPIWAVSFTFLFTQDATTYLFWETNAVIVPTEAFLYFEVTGLIANAAKNPTTAQVLSYSFKDGDRIRIIKDVNTGSVLGDTYDAAVIGLVTDPTIDGAVTTPAGRQFIKIKKIAPFTSIVNTDNYVIELYSPAQQLANADNQAYFEIGRQYYIIDAGLSTRAHSGEVTNQVVGSVPAEFNFYKGNSYFRARNIFLEAGSVGYTIFNVMDINFVDFYLSGVNNIQGRASIIDANARRQYYSTLIRFGQAYQADTNINGLSRFYPNNFDEYDYNYGDVVRMKVRQRYLKIFQKFKIGIVPLYGQITKDANGNSSLIVTDKLLNPIQYRVGNLGLSSPESLASWHFADYGCDTNEGIIWRDSDDGVIPISQLYKVDSWAIYELPLRKGDVKIYGAFNPVTNQYIIAMEAYTEAVCIPLSIPSYSLPNATVGTPYSYTVALTGTQPFILSNQVSPAWLSFAVTGSNLIFSGTPVTGDIDTGIIVSFNIVNPCGAGTSNTTINVPAPACVPVSIIGTPMLPTAYSTLPYNYAINLGGSAPFTLSGLTNPAWMSIAISGSYIIFSGTPASSDIGTGKSVALTVSNACGSTTFSGTFDVDAGVIFGTTTLVSSDALNDVEIANLVGQPAIVVTVTMDNYTNNNGGTLSVNGTPVTAIGETWNVTLDGSGHGSLNMDIAGVTNPTTGILGHFTITSVSAGAIGTPDFYQISKAF